MDREQTGIHFHGYHQSSRKNDDIQVPSWYECEIKGKQRVIVPPPRVEPNNVCPRAGIPPLGAFNTTTPTSARRRDFPP